ncbi:hypothetical protein HanPI659440_Chr09g0341741 [Helianthus annuus]|nr:hypothetical protein HanPI659440_Chr09g0341741 [Helianthus annuus]
MENESIIVGLHLLETQNHHTVVRVKVVLRWLNDLAFNLCVVFPPSPPDHRHHHHRNHHNVITTTIPPVYPQHHHHRTHFTKNNVVVLCSFNYAQVLGELPK